MDEAQQAFYYLSVAQAVGLPLLISAVTGLLLAWALMWR